MWPVIVCLEGLFCLPAKIPVITNSLLLLKRELCLREVWYWKLWDSPISLSSFLPTPLWIHHPPPSLASFPLTQSLFYISKNSGMSPIDRTLPYRGDVLISPLQTSLSPVLPAKVTMALPWPLCMSSTVVDRFWGEFFHHPWNNPVITCWRMTAEWQWWQDWSCWVGYKHKLTVQPQDQGRKTWWLWVWGVWKARKKMVTD